jgi:uridine kinase
MVKNTEADIILICGGSCSGKTTLAAGLNEKFQDFGSSVLLSMDNYYYDLSSWDPREADEKNFDCPEAIDFETLLRDLSRLRSRCRIRDRRYDYKTHCITELDSFVEPADFIILEGIFALYYRRLRELAKAAVFVHADADIRLARRIERDITERRLPADMVVRQYLQDVRPMHKEFIEPYRRYADLVLDSNDCTPLENLHETMEFLKNILSVYEKK